MRWTVQASRAPRLVSAMLPSHHPGLRRSQHARPGPENKELPGSLSVVCKARVSQRRISLSLPPFHVDLARFLILVFFSPGLTRCKFALQVETRPMRPFEEGSLARCLLHELAMPSADPLSTSADF